MASRLIGQLAKRIAQRDKALQEACKNVADLKESSRTQIATH
jgi:hypothetical protein